MHFLEPYFLFTAVPDEFAMSFEFFGPNVYKLGWKHFANKLYLPKRDDPTKDYEFLFSFSTFSRPRRKASCIVKIKVIQGKPWKDLNSSEFEKKLLPIFRNKVYWESGARLFLAEKRSEFRFFIHRLSNLALQETLGKANAGCEIISFSSNGSW